MRTAVWTKWLTMGWLAGLPSCAQHFALYDISLEHVERPAERASRYGQRVTTAMKSDQIRPFTFEDSLVLVQWIPSDSDFSVTIRNRTDQTVKVIWDDAAFVDPDGISHRVMHGGVRFVKRSESQPPSVIVGKGMVVDIIVPADFVALASEWRVLPFLPTPHPDWDPRLFRAAAKASVGKTVQVLLPLEFEGVTNDYLFTFVVRGVDAE
jgi:hypothetical protein